MDRKQLVLIGLLCLAILPFVSAEDNVISNQTYSSGANIALTNGTYRITVGVENITSLLLQMGNETSILDEGGCKRLEPELLCYEEKVSTTSVRIAVLDLRATVTAHLELNDSETFYYGDIFDAAILLNNTGRRAAQNVKAWLRLPLNFTILDNDCPYNGTHILWTGTVQHDTIEDCDFTYRIDGDVEEELQLQSNYTTYGENYEAESNTAEVEARLPFPINITLPNLTGLEPGQPFTVHISTYNNNTVNITLSSLRVIYGDYGTYLSSNQESIVQVKDDYIKARKLLEFNDSLNLTVQANFPYAGVNGTLDVSIAYNFSNQDQTRTFHRYTPFSTIAKDLELTVSPEDLDFEAYQNVTINISVRNPYTGLTINGYDTDVNSPLLQGPYRTKRPYLRERQVAHLTFIAPNVQQQKTEKLTVTVAAPTADGQKLITTQTYTITIKPLQEIAIEKTYDESPDNTTPLRVTVKATNTHHEPVTITFQEDIPEGLFVSGPTQATITLAPQQTATVLTYGILSTAAPAASPISLTTAATYAYAGQNLTVSKQLSLPATLLGYRPIPEEQQEEQNQTTLTEEQKKPPIDPERRRNTLLILFASLVGLILYLVLSRDTLRYIYIFQFRHRTLIKQYQSLLNRSELLRKRQTELKQMQHLLTHRIGTLTSHVDHYKEKLPEELAALEEQRAALKKTEELLNHQHEQLVKRLQLLQKKEQLVASEQTHVTSLLKHLEDEEHRLHEDQDTLGKDLEALRQEQERLNKQQELLLKDQQAVTDIIATFKNKQVDHLNSRMHLLAKRRHNVLSYHHQLEDEEQRIKKEFESIKHDLDISREDLQAAAKVYKESDAVQQQKT